MTKAHAVAFVSIESKKLMVTKVEYFLLFAFVSTVYDTTCIS